MVSLSNVLEAVVNTTDVPAYQLMSKSRKKEIAMGRHLFSHMARIYTNCSLVVIGEFLGGRDYTTVINSIRTAQNMIDTDYEVFVAMVSQCNKYINHHFIEELTFTITIPKGVEYSKVKDALEVFGVVVK